VDNKDDTKTTSISYTLSKYSYPKITTAEGDTSYKKEESFSQTGNDDNMDNDFKAWVDKGLLTKTLPLDDVQAPASVTASTDSNNISDWDNLEWPEIEPVTTSSWERTANNMNTSGSLLKSSYSLLSSKSTTESDNSLKGRLNQSDIERLKQQAEWSKKPDYFADMQPVINNSKSPTSLSVKDINIKDSTSATIESMSLSSYQVCKLYPVDPNIQRSTIPSNLGEI